MVPRLISSYTHSIFLHREQANGAGLPNVLLVVVVHTHGVDHVRNDVAVATAHDADLYEDARKEADAELHGRGDTAARRHGPRCGLDVRLRNGAQVVVVLVRRHADTEIPDGDGQIRLLGGVPDEVIRASLEVLRVGGALVVDLPRASDTILSLPLPTARPARSPTSMSVEGTTP
eukprot:CAMPEP_0203934382 /NCGR_PEP_ID=MMETSP0359-20131031/72345_1 /ASSEMBLY_ACC=CAM_ASM_000338 /TAXON_ID=268821 /ORGANISM="Scrippsiella Hangoei, Strain SHTV-5" /LENGTH=174 /DNA_ID=CAMNT_0050864083 /DNA_START=718 /DNA_END=1238 /DNA_ORIENTATION=-